MFLYYKHRICIKRRHASFRQQANSWLASKHWGRGMTWDRNTKTSYFPLQKSQLESQQNTVIHNFLFKTEKMLFWKSVNMKWSCFSSSCASSISQGKPSQWLAALTWRGCCSSRRWCWWVELAKRQKKKIQIQFLNYIFKRNPDALPDTVNSLLASSPGITRACVPAAWWPLGRWTASCDSLLLAVAAATTDLKLRFRLATLRSGWSRMT